MNIFSVSVYLNNAWLMIYSGLPLYGKYRYQKNLYSGTCNLILMNVFYKTTIITNFFLVEATLKATVEVTANLTAADVVTANRMAADMIAASLLNS